MSPELALVTIVALLWGPTAIWLLLQLVRGRRETFRREVTSGTKLDAAGPPPGTGEVQALVAQYGFWVCGVCKSLNRRDSGRCYGCRTAQDAAMRDPSLAPSPGTEPAPGMVPVMVDESARPDPGLFELMPATLTRPAAGAGAEGDVVPGADVPAPTAATSLDGQVVEPAVLARVTRGGGASDDQPPAGRPARVSDLPGRAPDGPDDAVSGPTGAPPRSQPPIVAAPPPAGVPMLATDGAGVGSPRAGLPICPFLGIEEDPSTWYDFADPRNLCHAVPTGDLSPLGFLRRLITGRPGIGRSQVIAAAQQQTRCLTAEHRECARYVVAMSVVAPPTRKEAQWVDLSPPRMAHPMGEPDPDVRQGPGATPRPAAGPDPTTTSNPTAVPDPAALPSPAATTGTARRASKPRSASPAPSPGSAGPSPRTTSAATEPAASNPRPAAAPAGDDQVANAAAVPAAPPSRRAPRSARTPRPGRDTGSGSSRRRTAAAPAPGSSPAPRPSAPAKSSKVAPPPVDSVATAGPAARAQGSRSRSTAAAKQAEPTPAQVGPNPVSGDPASPPSDKTPSAKQGARSAKGSGRKRKADAEAAGGRGESTPRKSGKQSSRPKSRRTAA